MLVKLALAAGVVGLLASIVATECAAAEAAANAPVFADNFEKGLENWVSEGPWTVNIKDGLLHVKTTQDASNVGQYVWCRRELPNDFRVEFDMTPASDSGFFLIFFCVKGVKGEDILGPDLFDNFMNWKTWKPFQDFDKYTTNRKTEPRISCYHISFRRGNQVNCNLRKNPGLVMLKSSKLKGLLPQNKPAHLVLVKVGGHITLDVNGEQFMDETDAKDIYSGGRFGFRQVYDSEGTYSNVKFFDLTKK